MPQNMMNLKIVFEGSYCKNIFKSTIFFFFQNPLEYLHVSRILDRPKCGLGLNFNDQARLGLALVSQEAGQCPSLGQLGP